MSATINENTTQSKLFRLADMTWEDAKERIERGDVVIFPLGATEQHGQYLPIGTDSFAAIDLAEAAARKTQAVVAPPVWYGMSAHRMVLPGTISIRPEMLRLVGTRSYTKT